MTCLCSNIEEHIYFDILSYLERVTIPQSGLITISPGDNNTILWERIYLIFDVYIFIGTVDSA